MYSYSQTTIEAKSRISITQEQHPFPISLLKEINMVQNLSRKKEDTEKTKEEYCNRATATLHSYIIYLILKKKHSNLRLR